MDPRKMLSITAHMDGQRVIAKNIGKMRKVSEMELVALCNMAELGIMSVFASLDGESGEKAEAELERHAKAIGTTFSNDGKANGLMKLVQTCTAMLRGERFNRYLVQDDDPPTRGR